MTHPDLLIQRAKDYEHRLVLRSHVLDQMHAGNIFKKFNTRVALAITFGFGSMWAFYILMAWQLGWIAWQTTAGQNPHIIISDPYPFTFCLFLSNLIQLWALPAIMVGQNVQAAHQDELAKADHETLSILHEMQVAQTQMLSDLHSHIHVGNND